MKGLMIVLGTVLLFALLVVPSTPASAAGATCVSTPGSGSLGTVFQVTCTGFSPNVSVWAWLTEPDGHAFSGENGFTNLSFARKTDGAGNATATILTRRFDGAAIALGQWAITIQAGGITGIARFTFTGGTEGVSGATLSGDSATAMVTGAGFAANEIVSIWYDYPNGDCSGLWNPFVPGVEFGVGMSTVPFGDVKASAAGTIAFKFGVFDNECRGTYHIVARGNSSGLGAETSLTTPDDPVATNATLVASPNLVEARGGLVSFAGAGYSHNTGYTCWETSPQGQVLPAMEGTTSSSGTISFSFHTGGFFFEYDSTEGALGQWAVTCRDGAGNTGIARFSIFGNAVDP